MSEVAANGNTLYDTTEGNLAQTEVRPIPVGNQILVKQDVAATMAGKIIIPDAVQKRPWTGVVVAAGEGAISLYTGVLLPMKVRVGDHVIYSRFSGDDIEIAGESYKIMFDGDVKARMPREGEEQYELFQEQLRRKAEQSVPNQMPHRQKEGDAPAAESTATPAPPPPKRDLSQLGLNNNVTPGGIITG